MIDKRETSACPQCKHPINFCCITWANQKPVYECSICGATLDMKRKTDTAQWQALKQEMNGV